MMKRCKNPILYTLIITITIAIAVAMIHMTVADIRFEALKLAAHKAQVEKQELKWVQLRPAIESLLKALDETNEAFGAMLGEYETEIQFRQDSKRPPDYTRHSI